MWIEFHDKDGRVEVEDLTFDGIHLAKYLCEAMSAELTEAEDKLNKLEEE